MKEKNIIILGSGLSILDLSKEEICYLNNCDVIIAINKFMAFYKKSGILPTHVYYVDTYEESNVLLLQYIFNICRKDNLKNLTFILGKEALKNPLTSKRLSSKLLSFYLKKTYLEINEKIYKELFYEKINKNLFLVPRDCRFELISHQFWLEGNVWSNSLKEPLFHYRGSLSTVFNYVSIKYPNRSIKLIGVDFNSPKYFFQDELEKLNFDWQDWSTPITKEKGLHFSAIPYQGTTIFDKFDFIIENLNRSGNEIYSCNPQSLLVTQGLVKYSPVIS